MSELSTSFLMTTDDSYERKREQAQIPHALTLLVNAVYNGWQFQILVTGNRTEIQFHSVEQKKIGHSSQGI